MVLDRRHLNANFHLTVLACLDMTYVKLDSMTFTLRGFAQWALTTVAVAQGVSSTFEPAEFDTETELLNHGVNVAGLWGVNRGASELRGCSVAVSKDCLISLKIVLTFIFWGCSATCSI
jgi:hypothetical protein